MRSKCLLNKNNKNINPQIKKKKKKKKNLDPQQTPQKNPDPLCFSLSDLDLANSQILELTQLPQLPQRTQFMKQQQSK